MFGLCPDGSVVKEDDYFKKGHPCQKGISSVRMKLSVVFELLLIFLLIAFAASRNQPKSPRTDYTVLPPHSPDLREPQLGVICSQATGQECSTVSDMFSDSRPKTGLVATERKTTKQGPPNRYCACTTVMCNCCREFAGPLKGPGCASLNYLQGDSLMVTMSFGDRVLHNTTISGKKPKPVCMSLPGGISKFCGRVYGISKKGESFKACLGLELNKKKVKKKTKPEQPTLSSASTKPPVKVGSVIATTKPTQASKPVIRKPTRGNKPSRVPSSTTTSKPIKDTQIITTTTATPPGISTSRKPPRREPTTPRRPIIRPPVTSEKPTRFTPNTTTNPTTVAVTEAHTHEKLQEMTTEYEKLNSIQQDMEPVTSTAITITVVGSNEGQTHETEKGQEETSPQYTIPTKGVKDEQPMASTQPMSMASGTPPATSHKMSASLLRARTYPYPPYPIYVVVSFFLVMSQLKSIDTALIMHKQEPRKPHATVSKYPGPLVAVYEDNGRDRNKEMFQRLHGGKVRNHFVRTTNSTPRQWVWNGVKLNLVRRNEELLEYRCISSGGTSAPAPEEEFGGLDVRVMGLTASMTRESRLMFQPKKFLSICVLFIESQELAGLVDLEEFEPPTGLETSWLSRRYNPVALVPRWHEVQTDLQVLLTETAPISLIDNGEHLVCATPIHCPKLNQLSCPDGSLTDDKVGSSVCYCHHCPKLNQFSWPDGSLIDDKVRSSVCYSHHCPKLNQISCPDGSLTDDKVRSSVCYSHHCPKLNQLSCPDGSLTDDKVGSSVCYCSHCPKLNQFSWPDGSLRDDKVRSSVCYCHHCPKLNQFSWPDGSLTDDKVGSSVCYCHHCPKPNQFSCPDGFLSHR
uniref:DUF4773 domain-containing protein n=1 Tax=Timema cristinae TaxID=61476 RepID=A0A7R9CSW7_TIMCR|nr:unnamed protein product [Timema cristinae]